jgi:hypothetical protein
VSERPAKGIQVDPDNPDDPPCRRAPISGGVGACKPEVQRKIQHRRRLDGGSDKQRESTADAVHQVSNVKDGGGHFDCPVDTSRQE